LHRECLIGPAGSPIVNHASVQIARILSGDILK